MSKRQARASINIFDLIDSTCTNFRQRWKSGEHPRIEDYLEQVPAEAQPTLFRNLLQAEIRYEQREGQTPNSDQYHQRFPQFSKQIRDAFNEPTLMSMEALHGTSVDEAGATVVLESPAASRLGGYELVRELGRGGFGVVYESRHVRRNELVALKTLPIGIDGQTQSLNDAERLHKFRQEFRSLSEVNHPNLVGMQTLEVDGEQWFFTMDLVEGVDFLEYVRPVGRLHEDRLRGCLKQLVEGVIALHEHRIVHRDLKPNNVLIDANGNVVLLDFGLVAELQEATGRTLSLQSQHFAGTPRYAAPEQAAGTRSATVDWYALGVMLYEALTGEVPFTGTAVQVMVKKQTEDAPRLVGRDDVPRDLAELVDRLLQREPNQRPGAAAICQAVGIAADTVSHDSTDSTLPGSSTLAETFLVGRESQLAQLEFARQQLLQQRAPIVVFVRGRSGEGKTSLVEKFLQPLYRNSSMLVLSGRCYDRESVPFKAIDCIIDALVAHLRSRSRDDVHALVPDDIHMLAQLFPVLRRVPAIADRARLDITGIDSRQIRYRAFAALREMLATISRSTPVILFIDDLQWGDADSARALFELLLPPNPPTVMLLGSYRSDEANESPFLQQWNTSSCIGSQVPAQCYSDREPLALATGLSPPLYHEKPNASAYGSLLRRRTEEFERLEENAASATGIRQLIIEVSSLTEDQCLSLLSARLGLGRGALRQQARDLFQAAHGNPYFLEQLMEGFDAETGAFQAVPLNEIINRKLHRLPDDATALLEAIAIAGQAVKLEEAARVSEQSKQTFATITHMRSERLVRLIGSSDQQLVDTYHDKIRETVLDGMEVSKRCQLHTRFGEFLEQTANVTADEILAFLSQDAAANEARPEMTDRIYDLAYHFHAADDSRAFAYQLMAGEESFHAYASEDAVEFLRRADATLPDDASEAVQYRLQERLATSLARLGRFEEAILRYDASSLLAPSEIGRAVVKNGLAVVHHRMSDFDRAIEYWDQALIHLGCPRPRSRSTLLVVTLASFLRCHLTWCTRPAKTAAERRHAQLASQIFNYLAWAELIVTNTLRFAHATTSQVLTSFRSGRPDQVALALTWLGWASSAFSLITASRWYLARAMRFAEQSHDFVAQAVVEIYIGGTLYTSGKLEQAERQLREATSAVDRLGDSLYRSMVYHVLRHTYYVQGDCAKERESAMMELQLGERVSDRELICWGQYGLANAEARMGRLREAHKHIDASLAGYEGRGKLASEPVALHHLGFVCLQSSNYREAVAVFGEARSLIVEFSFYNEFAVRTYPWLMESLIGPQWRHSQQSYEIKRASRLGWASRFFAWRFPTIHPHTLRILGRLACVKGRPKRALRYFKKSVASARQIGAHYDLARSLLDLAALDGDRQEGLRAEAVAILRRLEAVIPRAERWQLGEMPDESCIAPHIDSRSDE